MTNKMIAKLESKGGKRWIKGNMDRMYFNSSVLGLELEYRKTGSICDASFRGKGLSNTMGGNYKAAKTYIDLETGDVCSDFDDLADAVRELIAQAQAEIDAESPEGEPEAPAMSAKASHCQYTVLKTIADTYADFSPHDRAHPRFAEFDARLKSIRTVVSACTDEADLLACYGSICPSGTKFERIRAFCNAINNIQPANDTQRALLGLALN